MEIIRGYCVDEMQAAALLISGIPLKAIYRSYIKAETISACVASFRRRPGVIVVAAALERPMKFGAIRVVGFTAERLSAIFDLLHALERAEYLRRAVLALQ